MERLGAEWAARVRRRDGDAGLPGHASDAPDRRVRAGDCIGSHDWPMFGLLLPFWRAEGRFLDRVLRARPAADFSMRSPASGGSSRACPNGRAPDVGDRQGRLERRHPALVGLSIGIVIGLTVALVTFGWVGRSAATPAATSVPVRLNSRSLAIQTPVEGALVLVPSLDVSAIAGGPLGTVHLVVATGTRVLGAADVTVERAGRFRVTVPLSGPKSAARARLTITVGEAGGSVVLGTLTVRVCTICA